MMTGKSGLRGIFVTGTGTDIGKSVVAAGLLRALRGRGLDAVPMKPVQTGCLADPEGVAAAGGGPLLNAPDLEFSLAAAGLNPDACERELMCPYRYVPACSPHLAARQVGVYPDFDRVESCARELLACHQAVIVESAGGLLAPIDEDRSMRDLIVRLGLPPVIVAHAGLGTINHALMTVECLRAAGVEPLGVILNLPSPPAKETDDVDRMTQDENPRAIERLGKLPILGRIGWLGAVPCRIDWDAFDRGLTELELLFKNLKKI